MTNNPSNPDFNLIDCPARHFSFMLRGMETRTQMPAQSQPGSDWRFSLRDPGSETVYSFRNFELLVDFMQNLQNEQTLPQTEKGNDKNAA